MILHINTCVLSKSYISYLKKKQPKVKQQDWYKHIFTKAGNRVENNDRMDNLPILDEVNINKMNFI